MNPGTDTTEMSQVTLRIRHTGAPECEVSAAHPGVTMRSVSSMTGRSTRRKRIIELSGDANAFPDFVADFRAADPIIAVDPVTPLDRTPAYLAVTFNAEEWDSIAGLLAELGVHYRTGTTISEGWERWTLYLGPDDDLSAVVDALEARGNEAELVRTVPMDDVAVGTQLDLTSAVNDLTARQREALSAAIEAGYYGPDKEADVEAIAEAMGVGPTTAWEHLARAEGKLMGELGPYLE